VAFDLREAVERIGSPVLVQAYVSGGQELLLGLQCHPELGPVRAAWSRWDLGRGARIAALARAVEQFAALGIQLGRELSSLDINPLVALPDGGLAIAGRARNSPDSNAR
jgi:hypothetical protein